MVFEPQKIKGVPIYFIITYSLTKEGDKPSGLLPITHPESYELFGSYLIHLGDTNGFNHNASCCHYYIRETKNLNLSVRFYIVAV